MTLARRPTSRIVRELSEDKRAELNRRLQSGCTYDELTEWLNGEGFDISRSAVGRYGQGFAARLERLSVVREQVSTLVERTAGRPATEMAHAANEMAMELIVQKLLETEDLKDADIVDVLAILSKLESSGARREKLRTEFDRGVTVATEAIKEQLRREVGKDPELTRRLAALVDRVAVEHRKRAA